jgi:tetratricopeptide (TPR) repeat protein
MRKIFSLALILIFTITLTACGSKYRVEREGMPEELKTRLENQIVSGEEMLVAAEDDSAKAKALLEIAFANEQLGYFDEAIPVYKKILTTDPNHFPALNNLGVIYETVGEFETSAKYYGRLLEANPSNTEVLSDAIRVLVAAELFESAQVNLESFIKYNQDTEGLSQFISNQFTFIQNARAKAK